jgi:hypothetical protein
MQRGIVYTSGTLDTLEDCIRRGGYNMVTVIAGWGPPEGWNRHTRKRVLEMVPHVCVRTLTGDPSYKQTGEFYLIDPNRTRDEISPWYAIKQNINIVLGNEPNWSKGKSLQEVYEWAYTFSASVSVCRNEFTGAKIISPAPMLDQPNWDLYFRIAKQSFLRCDYIGAHIYEHFGWGTQPSTGTYEAMKLHYVSLFGNKDWYITEMGINSPDVSKAEKGSRYAKFLRQVDSRVKGAAIYHLETLGTVDKNYQVYPEGDMAFHKEWFC